MTLIVTILITLNIKDPEQVSATVKNGCWIEHIWVMIFFLDMCHTLLQCWACTVVCAKIWWKRKAAHHKGTATFKQQRAFFFLSTVNPVASTSAVDALNYSHFDNAVSWALIIAFCNWNKFYDYANSFSATQYMEASSSISVLAFPFVDHYMISLSMWLMEIFLFWTDLASPVVCVCLCQWPVYAFPNGMQLWYQL